MLDRLWFRCLMVWVCAIASFVFRHRSVEIPLPYWHLFAVSTVLFILAELTFPTPRGSRRSKLWMSQLGRLSLVAMALMSIGYLLKISDVYSRLWSLYWLLSSWLCLGALETRREAGQIRHRLIIIGDADAARAQAHIQQQQVPAAEIITLEMEQAMDWLAHQTIGQTADCQDEILLVGRMPEEPQRSALILALHGHDVPLRYCLDHSSASPHAPPLTVPLLPTLGTIPDLLKRIEDLVIGLPALLLCLPVMAVLAALIYLDNPGPVLFTQRRLGLGGRAFTIYKFRTMVITAAQDVHASQVAGSDDRITRLGAFLRLWGLDELPQLFNVLKGEMSLVGPRPHAFPHDLLWGTQVPSYTQRFRVRPGLTGLAQVKGCRGYARSIDDIKTRVALDLDYIARWSLMLDIRILLATMPALLDSRKAASTPDQCPDQ